MSRKREVDWPLTMLAVFVIVGLLLTLAISTISFFGKDSLGLAVTALSALFTAGAAVAAAYSAHISASVAQRWPEEQRQKLLMDKWLEVEEGLSSLIEVVDKDRDFFPLYGLGDIFDDGVSQNHLEALNETFERRKVFPVIESGPEAVLEMLAQIKRIDRLTQSWSVFENRESKHEVLGRLSRFFKIREYQLVSLIGIRFYVTEILEGKPHEVDRYNGENIAAVFSPGVSQEDSLGHLRVELKKLENLSSKLDIHAAYEKLLIDLRPNESE